MARPNCGGERVAFRLFDELHRLVRIRQASVPFIYFDIFFYAAQPPDLGFNADAFGMRLVHNAFCDRDILFKRLMAGIDYKRAMTPAGGAIRTRLFDAILHMARKATVP